MIECEGRPDLISLVFSDVGILTPEVSVLGVRCLFLALTCAVVTNRASASISSGCLQDDGKCERVNGREISIEFAINMNLFLDAVTPLTCTGVAESSCQC